MVAINADHHNKIRRPRYLCTGRIEEIAPSAIIPGMPRDPHHYRQLYELFASVKDEKEAELLLQDILTPQELDSVAERWQLVQALASGMPQREIAKKLNISISKITRGSRMLQYGEGGFRHFLGKMKR